MKGGCYRPPQTRHEGGALLEVNDPAGCPGGYSMTVLLMPLLHAGFYVSYNNSMLEPNITAAVRKMHAEHPNAPLYAIGHSMGAALATICAMDVKFKVGLRDVRLYTFGSPRVGNLEFANFVYGQTTVRRCLPTLLTAACNSAC